MVNASSACFCMGPQDGEPFCPCLMRSKNIQQRNGRWVQPEEDLGKVNIYKPLTKDFYAKTNSTI